MAITVQTYPDTFRYAGNDIPVVLDVGQVADTASVVISATSGAPPAGAIITFFFDTEELEFNYNYTSFVDFFTALNSSYLLRRYFDVSYSNNVITLTSFTTDDLNLQVLTSSFAPAVVTVQQGGTPDIRCLLGIDIYDGTRYVPTDFDKSHRIASDGRASYNIASAFIFQKLDLDHQADSFLTKAIKYRLRYAQQGGEVFLSTNDLFVVQGAFDKYYIGSSIAPGNYLTASPRFLRSRDDEPRFLSVIATADYTQCKLTIRATDFQNTTHTYIRNLQDLLKGEILNFTVSHQGLGLESESEAPFYKYSVQFDYYIGADAYSTETITIECDRSVVHNYATFLFLNSRGGIDTISFIGDTEYSTEFSGLQVQKDAAHNLATTETAQHALQYTYKQYSGYFDDYDYFCYIEELLNAEEVWWLKDGTAQPIVINRDIKEKGSPLSDLWQLDFEFMLAKNAKVAALKNTSKVTLAQTNISTQSTLMIHTTP